VACSNSRTKPCTSDIPNSSGKKIRAAECNPALDAAYFVSIVAQRVWRRTVYFPTHQRRLKSESRSSIPLFMSCLCLYACIFSSSLSTRQSLDPGWSDASSYPIVTFVVPVGDIISFLTNYASFLKKYEGKIEKPTFHVKIPMLVGSLPTILIHDKQLNRFTDFNEPFKALCRDGKISLWPPEWRAKLNVKDWLKKFTSEHQAQSCHPCKIGTRTLLLKFTLISLVSISLVSSLSEHSLNSPRLLPNQSTHDLYR
jgi:hypothetical protein